MNTITKTLKLFSLRIVKALVLIVSLSLSAKLFGIKIERDIWILAYNCILIIDLAIWGPINETFRAKFIFIKEKEGDEVAVRGLNDLLLVTSAVTILVFLLFIFFPEIPSQILAPLYSENELRALKLMLQILAPSLLINQITQLLISVLNAYNIFFVPEYAGFASSIANVLCLYFIAPYVGIYSLAISYYFSLLVLFLLLIYQIKKSKIPVGINFSANKIQGIKPYVLFALPFYVPYMGGQLNALIEKSIGSLIAVGIVSSIDYARKFIDIPLSTLMSVLTTILVPLLSEKFVNNKENEFIQELKNNIQLGLIVLGLLICFIIVGGEEIVNILYGGNGRISKDKVLVIYNLAICYSISSISIYMYTVFGLAHLCMQRGKVYAVWGLIAQIAMIVLNVTNYKTLGIYIFPFTLFTAHIIAGLGMRLSFKVTFKDIDHSLIKYLFMITIWGVIAYGIKYYLDLSDVHNSATSLFVVKNLLLGISLIGCAFIFNIKEKTLLVSAIRSRIVKQG